MKGTKGPNNMTIHATKNTVVMQLSSSSGDANELGTNVQSYKRV